MTVDERIEALTMNLELAMREIQEHNKQLRQDAEHIRALARVAEIHNARLERLEK